MYALGKPHPLRERCRQLLEQAASGDLEANVDAEVLQELLYVYSSRGDRKKALTVVEEMLILFPSPYAIKGNDILIAKDFMKQYAHLTARDAIHCAVTVNNDLEYLISTDKDFEPVKEIKLLVP